MLWIVFAPPHANFITQPPEVLDRTGFKITAMDLLLQPCLIIFLDMHEGDIDEHGSEELLD